jgi:arsenate reductase
MAEAIWNQIAAGSWKAHSAGSKPAGYVHPMAIKTLENMQVPFSNLESKSLDQFVDQDFDLVVTVCDNAKSECPMISGAKRVLHWPFEDPNDAEGSEAERMAVFQSVADMIKSRIDAFLNKLKEDDRVQS